MIGLMLHAASELPGSLHHDRLAVHVETRGHNAVSARRRVLQAGEGQASLLVGLLIVGQLQHRVDQVTDHVVDVVGEDPKADTDLRRGQAEPGRLQHRVGQVLDQAAQFGVEITDWLGRRTQHRIAEQTYRLDAHLIPPGSCGSVAHAQSMEDERALNAALRAARATPGSG